MSCKRNPDDHSHIIYNKFYNGWQHNVDLTEMFGWSYEPSEEEFERMIDQFGSNYFERGKPIEVKNLSLLKGDNMKKPKKEEPEVQPVPDEIADDITKAEVPFYYTIGENTRISCNIIKRLFTYEFMTMSALEHEEDTKNFDTLLQRIDHIEDIFNKAKEEIKAYKEKK